MGSVATLLEKSAPLIAGGAAGVATGSNLATMIYDPKTNERKTGGLLAGAGMGAAQGALAGIALGPLGIAGGALIGGLGGLLGGLFGEKKVREEYNDSLALKALQRASQNTLEYKPVSRIEANTGIPIQTTTMI